MTTAISIKEFRAKTDEILDTVIACRLLVSPYRSRTLAGVSDYGRRDSCSPVPLPLLSAATPGAEVSRLVAC